MTRRVLRADAHREIVRNSSGGSARSIGMSNSAEDGRTPTETVCWRESADTSRQMVRAARGGGAASRHQIPLRSLRRGSAENCNLEARCCSRPQLTPSKSGKLQPRPSPGFEVDVFGIEADELCPRARSRPSE